MAKNIFMDNRKIFGIISILKKVYPEAGCPLSHKSPFELLIATILSAQCTDERVNMVTPDLFKKYQGPAEMAAAPLNALEILIRSTGFYHSKALSIKGASRAIAGNFGGKVPAEMEKLLTLRGVARKTANVVLGCRSIAPVRTQIIARIFNGLFRVFPYTGPLEDRNLGELGKSLIPEGPDHIHGDHKFYFVFRRPDIPQIVYARQRGAVAVSCFPAVRATHPAITPAASATANIFSEKENALFSLTELSGVFIYASRNRRRWAYGSLRPAFYARSISLPRPD